MGGWPPEPSRRGDADDETRIYDATCEFVAEVFRAEPLVRGQAERIDALESEVAAPAGAAAGPRGARGQRAAGSGTAAW